MKYIIVIPFIFTLSACSLFSPKRAPEVVPSCFSDGEDQTKMCKAQRVNEESKIVITRCIGSQNREASPALRGKCVEKICSEGSNTDCLIKGDIRVLGQYAELVTSNMFADGETASAEKKHSAKEKKVKLKTVKATTAAAGPVQAPTSAGEVDTDPSVALPPVQEKRVVVEAAPPPPPPQKVSEPQGDAPSMSIALKPAKPMKKRASGGRAIASIKSEDGFKKVCIAKDDPAAPEMLRGKCATRSCNSGKCRFKGRKEMFDYFAKSDAG